MNKYLIRDIRNEEPGDRLYFFDANIWLLILDRSLQPKYYEQVYIDFWDKLTSLPEARKVVVANSLLISEVFNRYLRIKFESYKKEQIEYLKKPKLEIEKLTFKEDYRGSIDYQENFVAFTSEFTAYDSFIEIINDKAEEVNIMEMLNDMSTNSDFNDVYYQRFCKLNGFPIVTHDGDFRFKGTPILTCNKDLLAIKN